MEIDCFQIQLFDHSGHLGIGPELATCRPFVNKLYWFVGCIFGVLYKLHQVVVKCIELSHKVGHSARMFASFASPGIDFLISATRCAREGTPYEDRAVFEFIDCSLGV